MPILDGQSLPGPQTLFGAGLVDPTKWRDPPGGMASGARRVHVHHHDSIRSWLIGDGAAGLGSPHTAIALMARAAGPALLG